VPSDRLADERDVLITAFLDGQLKRLSQSRRVVPPPSASISSCVGAERMGVNFDTCLV